MHTFTGPELRHNIGNKPTDNLLSTNLVLLMTTVVVLLVGGRARAVQRVQMRRRVARTTSLVVLGERGVMMAFLLSRAMASMVNTLTGTEVRETNWLTEQ